MLNFKDMIAKDLDTFTNTGEFGTSHMIDGVDMICVIDTDVLAQRQGKTEFGINESDIQVFVKTQILEENGIEEKGYGAHLEVDGKIYTVMSWGENMGMSQITLSVPEMN